MPEPTPRLDELCVNTLRVLAIDAVEAAKSGHPGLPLGAAPMAHTLFSRFLKYCPTNPKWEDRDRFVLSAGHGSALLYALLHLAGYDLPLDELKRFRQLGSKTPGHPENFLTPGVEMATGPLGQGFATAVGMAMAERFLAAKYNRPDHGIVDHRTFVLCSDGDLMEGISNEAASLAGRQRLGKLVALYDDNHITIDGATELSFTESVEARFQALGWNTLACDGMDVEAVAAALTEATGPSDRPTLIRCCTTIGFGSPNKAGTSKSHGAPLGPDETKLTKQALGVPDDEPFWKSPEAVAFYAERAERGARLEREWSERWAAYASAFPSEAAELKLAWMGETPRDLAERMPTFADAVQTRQAGGKTLQALAQSLPNLIGGSADLAESNQTLIEGAPPCSPEHPDGRNVYFGIREHAMAAAVNGMNLHGGVRAFGATFLIFSDYCRPSIRLAALMRTPSIFVFTHDSIGVGEDGPTHQPIEQLASLRAIPNLDVMRPADGNETAACWAMAIERKTGPSLLALTRQPVPALTSSDIANHPARKGAYVLQEASRTLEVALIATGSEVGLAVRAREALEAKGIGARVVSAPSLYTYERQNDDYKASVLPRGALIVAIEAGSSMCWGKYASVCIGIDHFGESAPFAQLMEKFGFTVENVVAQVESKLGASASV